MDGSQRNHLKAYGIAYWTLAERLPIDWLLNYRGGSFLIDHFQEVQEECTIRGVTFQVIADGQATAILAEISDPEVNMEVVKLGEGAEDRGLRTGRLSNPGMMP